ncbi:MAG: TolB family protein, partial [Candidatus Thorarchaeota archaeon]
MSAKSVDFKKYLSIETSGGASWHPNKNQVVYVSNSSGSFQIYTGEVGDDSGQGFQKLTDEPDRCTNPKFLSDGTILFTRDELHWVTTTHDAKYRLNMVTDNYIYYISNELDRSRLDLYRRKIPLLENKPELLYKPVNCIVHVDVVSDDENQIVVTRRLSNVEHEIFILSLHDGKIKELTQLLPESSKTRWITVRYIDENHILVVTDYKSDIKRFGVLSTEGKFVSFDDLANKLNSSIEYTTWGKHAQYTYFTTNDEGYSSLFRGVFTPLGYTDYMKIEMEFKGTLSSGD